MRDRDPDAAAALVRYPITVSIGGKDVTDRTPAAFAERFSAIVTPAIAAAVVDACRGVDVRDWPTLYRAGPL